MSTARGKVIIVGCGVIGTACAYYLSQSGWTVEMIDRGEFGSGCSHANCGLICPSHVLPLAAPGALRTACKALFQKNSPFAIKPRLDPALWSWLLRFARRCNTHDMLEAARAIHALLQSSRSLYQELFDTEPLDAEWETRGLLLVFGSPKPMEHYAETDRLLRESFGLAATRYDGEAVVQREPALKHGLAGGWYYSAEAHLRPDKLLSSWRRLLETRGVRVHEQCELQGFDRQGRRARGIATSQGILDGEAFILAAGAWTPLLQKHLGCRIAIQPGKGYSITMPRPRKCPVIPLIFEEHRVVATPMKSGYRLGSTMEFAGYDTTLNRSRLQLLRDGASHYLQEPYTEPVLEEWYGWRPMTCDGKPIIDRSPILDNVFVAAGHNMLGLSMAPATGKLVAELLGGAQPHIDPEPYRALTAGMPCLTAFDTDH
jgi:D-amino-acid dehydrogenase